MSGYWRKYIHHKINQAILSLPENSPREALEKAIKNSWPKELGAKENFPYKVWLSEKDEFLIAYGFKKRKIKSNGGTKKSKIPPEVEGQLKLF